ncbi:MAG TPA: hypothetical protein VIV61_14395 [Candidatus Ozemobacteraceae bacterium]
MSAVPFERLFVILAGSLPTLLLMAWARPAHGAVAPGTALRLSLGGGFALLICRLVETALSELVAAPGWLRIAILAPVVEESARYAWIRIADATRVEAGTIAGGAMGISENLLKCLTEELPAGSLAFRIFATSPFHGLAGGLQSLSARCFFLCLAFHMLFNAGMLTGGFFGWIMTLGALWTSGCAWFIALQTERVNAVQPPLEPETV